MKLLRINCIFLQTTNYRGLPSRSKARLIELLAISDKPFPKDYYLMTRTKSIVSTGVLNVEQINFAVGYINFLCTGIFEKWGLDPPGVRESNILTAQLLSNTMELFYTKPDGLFTTKNTFDFRQKITSRVGLSLKNLRAYREIARMQLRSTNTSLIIRVA